MCFILLKVWGLLLSVCVVVWIVCIVFTKMSPAFKIWLKQSKKKKKYKHSNNIYGERKESMDYIQALDYTVMILE